MTPYEGLYDALKAWAEARGIEVGEGPAGPEKPAQFDGVSVTVDPGYDVKARCWYLAHSLGSIVGWSLGPDGTRAVYDELRAAKKVKDSDPRPLDRAVQGFSAFEELASEYGVWLLEQLGHGWAVPEYTSFARADVEAMARYHRGGKAPVWRDFFADWQARVARGEQEVRPYRPRAVPAFRPVPVPTQEVVQEQDGRP